MAEARRGCTSYALVDQSNFGNDSHNRENDSRGGARPERVWLDNRIFSNTASFVSCWQRRAKTWGVLTVDTTFESYAYKIMRAMNKGGEGRGLWKLRGLGNIYAPKKTTAVSSRSCLLEHACVRVRKRGDVTAGSSRPIGLQASAF